MGILLPQAYSYFWPNSYALPTISCESTKPVTSTHYIKYYRVLLHEGERDITLRKNKLPIGLWALE